MDESLKTALELILARPLDTLTDANKRFLKARRDYLTTEQQAKYADILGEAPQVPQSAEVQNTLAGEKNNEVSVEEVAQPQPTNDLPEPLPQDPQPQSPMAEDPVSPETVEIAQENASINETAQPLSEPEKNPYEDDGSSDPDVK